MEGAAVAVPFSVYILVWMARQNLRVALVANVELARGLDVACAYPFRRIVVAKAFNHFFLLKKTPEIGSGGWMFPISILEMSLISIFEMSLISILGVSDLNF